MIDNYKDFLKYIKSLDGKKKILLHACCAPCSTHCIKILKDYFDITVFYSNDNISPFEEYDKRLQEEIRFCKEFGIDVLYDTYKNEDYNQAVLNHEHDGERTIRCYQCYKLRLEKTAAKAAELGFDYFSTTLSISPYKVSKWLNEIGYEMQEKYNVKYLFSDFKKDEGYKDSIKLSSEYGLYRQDYCGCVYSKEEREQKR